MKNKITVVALCALLFALSLPVQAQQATKVYRIGFLRGSSASAAKRQIDAFREGLRELGYVESKNFIFEARYAEGKVDRLPELASELVRLKVDVILVSGTEATAAAKQATSTIPIVVGSAGDLVGAGLVASLARPGGNITGSTRMSPELSRKRFEILKEAVPKISRVSVILSTTTLLDKDELKEMESEASRLAVKLRPIDVRDRKEFQGAFAAMVRERADALVILQGAFANAYRTELTELAVNNRLPSMCETEAWTKDGCLISYGPDDAYPYRRAAIFVDKILKGAKPADLPVEQPMKFELVINLKTAKQIGLTIPPSVLYRADKLIR
jgi:ABC-type uncharacterized transport system substrate-binding protein